MQNLEVIITIINPSCEKETTFNGSNVGKHIGSSLFAEKNLMPNSDFEENELSLTVNENESAFAVTLPPLSVAKIQFKNVD